MELWLTALKLLPLLTLILTAGWVDAERLRTTLGLLRREKSTFVACKSAPSGTLTMGSCLVCSLWLWVAVSEPAWAVDVSGPTQHTRTDVDQS